MLVLSPNNAFEVTGTLRSNVSLKNNDFITFIWLLIEIPFFSESRKSYRSMENGILYNISDNTLLCSQ